MSLDHDLDAGPEVSPPRVRTLADPSPHRAPAGGRVRWTGPLGIEVKRPAALESAAWADEDLVAARLDLERAVALGPLTELVAPDLLPLEPPATSVELVRRFFAELDGRGIVAEPSGPDARSIVPLVLGELVARGLADRVVVAGAPGTAERIAEDLRGQLGLDLGVADRADAPALGGDRVVLDHDLAEAEIEHLAAEPWDLVVVDAAHQVAGDDASHVRVALARLVRDARWVLLLTPAPARDDLIEVHRLAELVRPGTFRPESEFRARLVDPDVRSTASRPDELRGLLAPVLVRTPRGQRAGSLRPRAVEHHEVELTPAEHEVSARAADLVARRLSGQTGWAVRRVLIPALADPGPVLAQAAHEAAALVDDAELEGELRDLAAAAADLDEDGPRARLLVTLVRLWHVAHRRVLVTTSSAGAAGVLHERLVAAGLPTSLLHEQLGAAARQEALAAWQGAEDAGDEGDLDGMVLVADDASLLGVDLGAAACLVCADLPWDPAVLDDRMAALGAFGGDELAVATFVAAGSLDAVVAGLLVEQAELFDHGAGWARSVLAELDPATRSVDGDDAPLAFSDRLVDALAEDGADRAEALEDLRDDLEAASRRARLLLDVGERIDTWSEEPETGAVAPGRPGLGPEGDEGDEDVEDDLDPDGFFGALVSASSAPAGSEGPVLPSREAFPKASVLRDGLARWAAASGGRVVRHEPGFVITEGLLGATPGRWVFDRAGMAQHPDALLVAPGSAALARLLAEVRAEVPVRAVVAEPVDLPMVDVADHVAEVRLVDRRMEAPRSWSATATWRVRAGATEEALLEVASGEAPAGWSDRRALDPGEPLPGELPDLDSLVEQVTTAATTALEASAALTEAAALTAAEASRARLLVHHHSAVDAARAVIEETVAGTPEHERATERLRALHGEHPVDARPAAASEGLVRASLVALQVDVGDDFVVVERWRHERGAEAEVRYPWAAGGVADRRSEVSGEPVARVALCDDGHLVDEGELVWCPGCERGGCEACGVARAVAPCPSCGTSVCGECRREDDRFGPCRQCRDPRRDEADDTEAGRAWRLGGEATLLVGARWAEVRRTPDAEPTVLVPDVDVDDLDRRRMRAAADAAGLPLDVGAGALDRGPRPLPGADDAWLAATPGATWKVVPGQGADVSVALEDFDGPDGPEPMVAGERTLGLGAVLERLRVDDPPPPPPAFVRTPHLDVERTAVVATGLVRTVDRVGADGTVDRLAEERADLLGEPGATGHLFRPVASVSLGAVELVLVRLHRSTIVRLTTPTGTSEWFVGPEPALTFGAELAWASWAEDEGLAQGAVLTVAHDRPLLEDDDLASPSGATLEQRTVVDVWGAEPRPERGVDGEHPDGRRRGATDVDLSLVGYDEVPDLVMAAPSESRRDLAEALHRHGREVDEVPEVPHQLAHRWFEVEEVWVGRSRVRLAYKVAPGEPAWPRLDDTHERASDFEVDEHGHLHEPGTGWQCLACGEHHCRACGPVGAMDDCGSCAQPACGLCRARAPRTVPQQSCDRCGARSCTDCGRVPDAVPCETCRRSVCSRCRVEDGEANGGRPRCVPCARLRPALEEEVDGLPDVLVAPGLHVELGCHGGEVSVLLLGSWRREVAICRGGEVVWWVHHDDEQGTTRQLLLAAARRWRTEGDLVPVATGWSTRPAVAGLGLLLVVEEAPEVRWAVEVGATTVGGSATAPRGTRPRANRSGGPVDHDELDAIDPSVVEAVQAQLGEAGGRGPIPAPAGRGPLGDRDPFGERLARLHLEPVGRVVVEDRRRATATWLTPGGLQRLVSEGDDDHRTEAPWQVGVRFAWMAEGWEPEPDVVAYALLGEFEAAVVRVGRHLALGVRGDDRVVWWTLRDVPGDLQRTLLGEHLTGEERPLDLRVVTDPGKVQGPTVRDATFIERRIEPVLEEVGAGDGDPDEALRAAAAWVRRTAAFPEPTGPALPEALVAELVQRADELSPPTLETVGIALQVVETWRQGIDEFPVPYRLTPGSTVGAVACVDTGGTSTMVLRDRSGHLVAEVVVCPWCGEGSCHRCHVLVQPCSVCTDAVCGSCALDDGRCPVCSTLAPLDRKQARHLGRKVGRRATVLRAEVDGRTVLAVRDGAWSVTVEQAGALAEPVANDGRAALLDWVAAAPPVAAPTVDPPPPPPPSAPPDGPAPDGDPTATRGAPPVA